METVDRLRQIDWHGLAAHSEPLACPNCFHVCVCVCFCGAVIAKNQTQTSLISIFGPKQLPTNSQVCCVH